MSQLIKTMLKRLLVFLIIFSLLTIIFSVPPKSTQAAPLTAMSDTMSRLQTSNLSSHDILFTLAGANTIAAGDTVVIDFDEDGGEFTIADSGWVVGDFDFNDGIERTIANLTQGAAPTNACTGFDGANNIGAEVDNDGGTITLRACATYTASGAGATVNIEIGSSAAGPGTDRITNSGGSGSTPITLTETTDSGTLAVPIMTGDQVTVSATVDPTITSALSGAGYPTCALGILSFSAVQGCGYTNTVSTNATSGYNSTIVENGNLCSPSVAVCTNAITDVADGTVTINNLEYGVSTSDTDAPGITANFDGTCDDGANETGSAITGSAQIYADEITSIASDATNLCHSASITATTPSGSYSHIVTHITTGNF